MAKILGIDLGTTNSAMAVVEAGQPKILENQEGQRTTPSYVAISKSGERLVGLLAKRQAVTNPENTIFSVKRLIGRRFSDPEIQKDKKLLPYEIRESSSGGVEIKMGDKWWRPEEISAMILQKLKTDAESRLGEKIDEVVITVPAYFDDSQRQATKNAGEIAGLKVKRIINEPTAAALAYGFDKRGEREIVVYDFGGGTFDVSVLTVREDVIEVKSTGGDTHLGGDDVDQKIVDFLVSEFKNKEGIDLSKDSLALQRLKEAAEKAKHELSSVYETEINLPFITSDASGPKHFIYKLTRAKLEELSRDFIEKSIEITKKVIKESGFDEKDIDDIILVGGQTRMPLISQRLKDVFGKEPLKDINPDEVVAIGAALQGGVLGGKVRDILLLDVTPLTLSIETLGGIATPMIPKNTTIPTSKTEIFTTAADNQTSVEIHVLQGERPMASDNRSLARFVLDGIPPAPRGVPQIEVAFDIDANGILKVTAKDKATGKSQSVKIEASTGLSKEEIERMKKEAEEFAKKDQEKKELIQSKNEAQNLIYVAQKSLKENETKISEEIKKEIEQKIEELKNSLNSDNVSEIKQKIETLSLAIQKIGQNIYGDKGKK
ncbi:molecular chaperone DnaK [bacterium]|nr:molecular chaperone DnaK [bacterium]